MKFNDLTLKDEGDFGFLNPFINDLFGIPLKKEFKEMGHVMKTDVKESEKGYEMQVEMPGFDKKDIKMNIEDGYLTISAERNQNKEEKDKEGNFIRRERSYGACSRSFYVGDVEEENVNAKLADGILTVTIPKQTKKLEAKKYIEIE